MSLLKTLAWRFLKNPKTTLGGGALGIGAAALISSLEKELGCNFTEAFAGVDWIQVLVFSLTQAFGAFTTDANGGPHGQAKA